MELSDGEPRVRAGLYGNLGALLMGAAGRLEEALEFTEMSIEAGKETSIPDASLTAGTLNKIPCTDLPGAILSMSEASQQCHAHYTARWSPTAWQHRLLCKQAQALRLQGWSWQKSALLP